MNRKRGLVITGGRGPGREHTLRAVEGCDMIIAADSGFDVCVEYRIEPDMVVGDMDSVINVKKLKHLPQEKVMRFPKCKDDTDTEIALKVLYDKEYEHITLVGGDGGRIDHFLGILYLFYRDPHPTVWLCESEKIESIEGDVHIHGRIGATVSFFPGSHGVCSAKSSGLKWELDMLEWTIGDCGISNEIVKTPVSLSPKSGRILMVVSLKEDFSVER